MDSSIHYNQCAIWPQGKNWSPMRMENFLNRLFLLLIPSKVYLQVKLPEISQSRLVVVMVKLDHRTGTVSHNNAIKAFQRLEQL